VFESSGTRRHSVRALFATVLAVAAGAFALLAVAVPAGALPPQPVDASDQGALAFVLFAVMCGLFAASLFYMDRVRRRRTGED
jgi:hypothetical protein